MGHCLAVLDEVRDEVLAEVVIRIRIRRIPAELVDQETGLEDVDAHGGQGVVGVARNAGRVGRLLEEPDDVVLLVHVHHAETARFRPGHLDAADRHVGAGVDVLRQHDAVVHLVDMVAGQNDDETRSVALDDVDVLGDGIGGAEVPVSFVDPLRGGQHIEHLVALGLEEAPAELQMADQTVGLVLGGHADAPDAGIHGVRERKVDDPALAAEEHRRLRPFLRQLLQTAAPSSGEDESHRLAGQRGGPSRDSAHFLPLNAESG